MFRCLVDAIEGCSDNSDTYWQINETIEAALSSMKAHCPQSCDQSAAYNCSLSYYDRVVTSFVDGVDCPALGRYVDHLQYHRRIKVLEFNDLCVDYTLF